MKEAKALGLAEGYGPSSQIGDQIAPKPIAPVKGPLNFSGSGTGPSTTTPTPGGSLFGGPARSGTAPAPLRVAPQPMRPGTPPLAFRKRASAFDELMKMAFNDELSKIAGFGEAAAGVKRFAGKAPNATMLSNLKGSAGGVPGTAARVKALMPRGSGVPPTVRMTPAEHAEAAAKAPPPTERMPSTARSPETLHMSSPDDVSPVTERSPSTLRMKRASARTFTAFSFELQKLVAAQEA